MNIKHNLNDIKLEATTMKNNQHKSDKQWYSLYKHTIKNN